jgi:hypothetical protein
MTAATAATPHRFGLHTRGMAARVSGQAVGGEVLLTGHTAALAPDIDGVLYEPRGRQPCATFASASSCSRPCAPGRT